MRDFTLLLVVISFISKINLIVKDTTGLKELADQTSSILGEESTFKCFVDYGRYYVIEKKGKWDTKEAINLVNKEFPTPSHFEEFLQNLEHADYLIRLKIDGLRFSNMEKVPLNTKFLDIIR